MADDPSLTPAQRRDRVAALLDVELDRAANGVGSLDVTVGLVGALERLTRLADQAPDDDDPGMALVANAELERLANLDAAAYTVASTMAAGGPIRLEDMVGTRFEALLDPLTVLARYVAERPA